MDLGQPEYQWVVAGVFEDSWALPVLVNNKNEDQLYLFSGGIVNGHCSRLNSYGFDSLVTLSSETYTLFCEDYTKPISCRFKKNLVSKSNGDVEFGAFPLTDEHAIHLCPELL